MGLHAVPLRSLSRRPTSKSGILWRRRTPRDAEALLGVSSLGIVRAPPSPYRRRNDEKEPFGLAELVQNNFGE